MTASLRVTDEVVSAADSAFEKVERCVLVYEGLGALRAIGAFLEPTRND